MPDVLLAAYRRAVAAAPTACHLPVSLLAAIGQVESGSLARRSLDAAHRAVPPVLGPVLDGVGTAAIRDTDGGRMDGNSRWDRAVGPMQFIPGTWAAFGVDADGDGRADPQDVEDAASSAAGYLCDRGRDLALASGLQSAILSYNHSTAYLATVLAWQRRFATPGGGTSQGSEGSLGTVTAQLKVASAKPSVATAKLKVATTKPKAPAKPAVSATVGSSAAGPTPSNSVTSRTAAKLAFSTAPSPTSTSGTALAPQPVVTVQDAAGNTVTTDTGAVTLTLTTPDGASLTCAANPVAAVSGVASFSGCAIDRAGTYTLTATDGSLTTATSSSVTITPGEATTFVIASDPISGSASSTASVGPITVQCQDSYGNGVPAPAGGTVVHLASDTSGGTVFATTPAGIPLTSLTIPAGASSATFYYGDTQVGSPVITVSGALISANQTEVITAEATQGRR